MVITVEKQVWMAQKLFTGVILTSSGWLEARHYI